MKKFVILALIVTGVIIFTIFNFTKIQNRKSNAPNRLGEPQNSNPISTVATNLEIPWSIAFLPRTATSPVRGLPTSNIEILVTERTGNLFRLENGKKTLIAKLPVKSIGEGGLLGLVIDPYFDSNNFIYLYYTYGGSSNGTLNRVVRYKLTKDKLSDEKILVDAIPGASNHNGGRIKFGPDGFLYITTGDAQEPSRAQDKNSLAGKILRVTSEGKVVSGNPFGTAIYSYGHRNPQGLTWDENGALWSTEHGRSGVLSGLDELNLIEPGKNYGWPIIQGNEQRQGMETPNLNSGNDTWAPSGAAYLNGSIFFGGLRGSALYEYAIQENKLIEHLKGKLGRIRDVVLGPDGFLYITTSNRDGRGIPSKDDDKILKVNPVRNLGEKN